MNRLNVNPYASVDWDEVGRYKSQFHAHTSHPPVEGHSGSDSPDLVIDDYYDAGYAVLALTDHEYNIEEATWPWTRWDRDPDDLGMLAVQAVELGGSDEGIDHDLLSLFCDLADTSGMSVHEVLDTVGDRGGLAVFPHPARYNEDGEWYVEYFEAHPHLLGVEVVNAADRYPTNRDVWDNLLSRLDGRPVWGFANDDYHGREEEYSFDQSRNILFVEEVTEQSVREALVDGRFVYQYVVDDAPPTLDAVNHDPDRGELSVKCSDAELVQWISDGEVVSRDERLDYRDTDGIGGYLRARLVSESGSETGTQPFLLEQSDGMDN